jgi:hypothetical protein
MYPFRTSRSKRWGPRVDLRGRKRSIDEGEGSPSRPLLAELRVEGQVIRLTDRARRGRDQMNQVVGKRLLRASAQRIQVVPVVVHHGQQDRVAEQLLHVDGVGVAGVGVITLAEEQDRVGCSDGPRTAVVVLAANGPWRSRGPHKPAHEAALEAAYVLEPANQLRPRAQASLRGRVGAADRRPGRESRLRGGLLERGRCALELRSVAPERGGELRRVLRPRLRKLGGGALREEHVAVGELVDRRERWLHAGAGIGARFGRFDRRLKRSAAASAAAAGPEGEDQIRPRRGGLHRVEPERVLRAASAQTLVE